MKVGSILLQCTESGKVQKLLRYHVHSTHYLLFHSIPCSVQALGRENTINTKWQSQYYAHIKSSGSRLVSALDRWTSRYCTSSLMSTSGIQSSPYSFFRNGFLTTNRSDTVFWEGSEEKTYDMPHGTSKIIRSVEGDPNWDSTAYNMIVVNETASFIDDHMASDRSEDPWFVYASLGAVHEPHSPPDYYLDGTPIAYSHQSRHMDMLCEMDKAVGSLVTVVEKRGLANNTIIIFTSDNGGLGVGKSNSTYFGHNSHGPLRGAKREIYEGGHRVPMIFRYDGQFPVNETRNHMVGLNDVYKTLCTLVEVPVPETSAQDSVSFADYIFSESNVTGLREHLATWAFGNNNFTTAAAIRFGSMKLIQHYGSDPVTELYDLENDIGEEINLALEKPFTDIIQKMATMMQRVGPCPKHRKAKFKMTTGPDKGKFINCTYFNMNPTKCSDGTNLDGEIMCNSICGRHKSACSQKFVLPRHR